MSREEPLSFGIMTDSVQITMAVLGPEGETTVLKGVCGADPAADLSNKRTVLMAQVGGRPQVALCSFVPNVCENVNLSLLFETGVPVDFSGEKRRKRGELFVQFLSRVIDSFAVLGPGTVHLSGRYLFDGELPNRSQSNEAGEQMQNSPMVIPADESDSSNESDSDSDSDSDEQVGEPSFFIYFFVQDSTTHSGSPQT